MCRLPTLVVDVSVWVDIVAKVENQTTLKISRKLIFGLLAAVSLFDATAEVRDRFWMKRYGPSRRRA